MIQWFPGHMAKAKKEMQSQSKNVDIVCEVLDARAPRSSANPMLREILNNKLQVLILNKADLADPSQTKQWKNYYESMGYPVIALNSKQPSEILKLKKELKSIGKPILEKWENKGLQKQALRLLIVGIPNVGKSTLINQLCKKKVAAIGDKPGVTKGQQWIHIDQDFSLLDTPGVLWPKFETEEIAQHLCLIGAIKDTHYYADDLCLYAMSLLNTYYPFAWQDFYHYPVQEDLPNSESLLLLTKKLGYREDYEQTARQFLRDLRLGKMGQFTWDRLEEESR